MSENNVLKVENVTMQFGGVIAVDNMNIEMVPILRETCICPHRFWSLEFR